MFSKRSFLVAALGLLAFAAGCGDDIDDARSVVEVTSIAENGVFVCGIIDAGADKIFPSDDDFVPAGHVPVTLQNRSYNDFITAETLRPYGDFVVTGIAVEWVPITGSTSAEALTNLRRFNYSAQYDVMIPKNSQTTFNVMLVPFAMKEDPYFRNLVNGAGGDGSTTPFTAGARMTFTGHDSGDERTVSFEAFAIVEFIGLIIEAD